MAPPCLWTRTFATSSFELLALTTDPADRVILAGTFSGVVDFGAGPMDAGPGIDAFVLALDSAGQLAFARHLPAQDLAGVGTITDVVADAQGNLYLTGSSFPIDLGSGPIQGAFLAKLDPQGNTLWAKPLVAQGASTTLDLDASGHLAMTLTGKGPFDLGGGPLLTSTCFDPSLCPFCQAMAVARFDLDGNHLSSVAFGDDEYGPCVMAETAATDANGNLLVGGYVQGPLTLAGTDLSQSDADGGVFALAVSEAGAPVWARGADATFNVLIPTRRMFLATDPAGNALWSGWYSTAMDYGGGAIGAGIHADLVKLDGAGAHVFSHAYGVDARPYGVASDSAGHPVLVGRFQGSIDFGAGPVASAGQDDVFLVKLDAAGAPVWTRIAGDAAGQMPLGLAVDSSDHAVVMGAFDGTIDFGGGPQPDQPGLATAFVTRCPL